MSTVLLTILVVIIFLVIMTIIIGIFAGIIYLGYKYRTNGQKYTEPVLITKGISQRVVPHDAVIIKGYEIIGGDFDGKDISEADLYSVGKAAIKLPKGRDAKYKKIAEIIKVTNASAANIYSTERGIKILMLKKIPYEGIVNNPMSCIYVPMKHYKKLIKSIVV